MRKHLTTPNDKRSKRRRIDPIANALPNSFSDTGVFYHHCRYRSNPSEARSLHESQESAFPLEVCLETTTGVYSRNKEYSWSQTSDCRHTHIIGTYIVLREQCLVL